MNDQDHTSEVEKRRDDALRRALATPPKPHKPKADKPPPGKKPKPSKK